MLTNAKKIRNYKLNGLDGEVGSIREFLFDDRFWTVRYLVITKGSWLNKRQLLISPYFTGIIYHKMRFINVNLTNDEIENSPELRSDMPITRRYEEQYHQYFNIPFYWGGPFRWGNSQSLIHEKDKWEKLKSGESTWDSNLQSSRDARDLNIQTKDDVIGHVDELIIDDETWAIRYLVIDTRKWLKGRKVLIPPQWIDRISWEDSKVFINLPRESIEKAPEYDENEELTRDYESRLYQHYNQMEYWSEESVRNEYPNIPYPGMLDQE